MTAIIRAIDVGHKNVKWTLDTEPEIACRVFPACAPLDTGRNLSEAFSGKRQTVLVDVNGLTYEVGPDALLAQGGEPSHIMDDDYCLSDEYLALVRGALALMKVPSVDVLVVGLPVTTFHMRRAALAKRLVGEHPVTSEKTVIVNEVKVLAQPHGALMDFAVADAQSEAMRSQRNLIIDCGARTFDWLVTQGIKIIERRSHATNRGIYDVLRLLAAEVGKRFDVQYQDYERLDHALRTRTNPQVCGKEFDLGPHLPVARKIAQEAVTDMRRYVQDASDIDNIIVSGGAAFFFKDAIRSAFPHHEIQEGRNGLYANVRGFARYGLWKWAQGERTRALNAESATLGGA
jgi:plasmid segregation protein ParM